MANEIIPLIIVGSFFVITGLFYAGSRVKKAQREKIRNKEDDIIFVQKHKEGRKKEQEAKMKEKEEEYNKLLTDVGVYVRDIPKSYSSEGRGVVTRKNKKHVKQSRKKI
jgi:hypothetical protein